MNLRELRDTIEALVEERGEDILDEPVYRESPKLTPRNAAVRSELVQVTVDPLWGYINLD